MPNRTQLIDPPTIVRSAFRVMSSLNARRKKLSGSRKAMIACIVTCRPPRPIFLIWHSRIIASAFMHPTTIRRTLPKSPRNRRVVSLHFFLSHSSRARRSDRLGLGYAELALHELNPEAQRTDQTEAAAVLKKFCQTGEPDGEIGRLWRAWLLTWMKKTTARSQQKRSEIPVWRAYLFAMHSSGGRRSVCCRPVLAGDPPRSNR